MDVKGLPDLELTVLLHALGALVDDQSLRVETVTGRLSALHPPEIMTRAHELWNELRAEQESRGQA